MDARGNRTQVVETLLQPDESVDEYTLDYAYDALSRLLSADYGSRKYEYTYDLAGNRTQEKETIGGTPTTTNYTYNAANQLTYVDAQPLTYDGNGNLTHDGTNAYAWDRANRLLSMGGVSYAYDGSGNRVQQTVSSIVTKYLLDTQPGLAVVLKATTGSDDTYFIHGPRGLERQQQPNGDWVFPVPDGLGSVRGVVDNAWPELAMLESRLYAPYGVPFGAQGVPQTVYGFTGEPTDENELVYLRARYLNPGLGVFASLDPVEGEIWRAMSLNGYGYAQSNPINLTDPSGEFCIPCAVAIIIGFGLVASGCAPSSGGTQFEQAIRNAYNNGQNQNQYKDALSQLIRDNSVLLSTIGGMNDPLSEVEINIAIWPETPGNIAFMESRRSAGRPVLYVYTPVFTRVADGRVSEQDFLAVLVKEYQLLFDITHGREGRSEEYICCSKPNAILDKNESESRGYYVAFSYLDQLGVLDFNRYPLDEMLYVYAREGGELGIDWKNPAAIGNPDILPCYYNYNGMGIPACR